MNLPSDITFRIPATSANLGPGFDIFGLALNLYSYFNLSFTYENKFDIFHSVSGQKIDIPEKSNLLRKAFIHALGKKPAPGIKMLFHSELPASSGFGSSASAIVAGVAAANYFLKANNQSEFSLQDEINMITELEGHPDNVCPARIGGFVFSSIQNDGNILNIKKKIPENLGLALIIPHYRVSTKKSRSKLPRKYEINQVLSNISGAIHWMEYLNTGNIQNLLNAIHSDKIHEPYRLKNIPGYKKMVSEIKNLGCYGATISGSGPGILVYYPGEIYDTLKSALETTVVTALSLKNSSNSVVFCKPDYEGLAVV